VANYGVYLPYESLKEYLGIPASQTSDDKLLAAFTDQASRKFDAHTARHFQPIKETRYFDDPTHKELNQHTWLNPYTRFSPIRRWLVSEECRQLFLDDDLLEVSLLTTNNTATTITAADYYLVSADNDNRTPYNVIELVTGSSAAFLYSTTPQRANAVTGFWGYHENWAGAWIASQDTVENNPLSDSGTSITVNDADGADLYGFMPRFQVQQLIRIEAEYLYLTAKNTTSNTLTVIRGVNGTTAAAHAQNTPIYIYQPMPEIVGAMQVLGAYSYRRKDTAGTPGEQGLTAPNGVLVMPAKLPNDVTDILNVYRRWTRN
jgi:hypothetical protein